MTEGLNSARLLELIQIPRPEPIVGMVESIADQIIDDFRSREEKVLPMSPGDWIRASSIAHLCPRREILARRHKVVRTRKFTVNVNMAFLTGKAFGRVMQQDFPDMFVGAWKCSKCGTTTDLGQRLPMPRVKCVCGREDWEAIEVETRMKGARVKGSPDLFRRITVRPEDDEVVEVKTLFDYEFKKMQEPKRVWVLQLHTYMWLKSLRRGRLLIFNKGGTGEGPRQWFKEFTYARDEGEINALRLTVIQTRDGLKKDELTGRICASASCDKALRCELVSQCFGTEEGVK